MVYPDSIEKKLGFESVRATVRAHCESEQGRHLADEMTFVADSGHMGHLLRSVWQMMQALHADEALTIGSIHDMAAVLARARIEGAFLTAQEVASLRASLNTVADIAAFFAQNRADDGSTPYPDLDVYAAALTPYPAVVADINRILDRWGEVADSASSALADIRRHLASMSGTLSTLMRRVIASAVKEGLIDSDTTPAMRDGCMVIPVAPMNKRKIPGIVHDESASGKTVYIEPAEVVAAGNRLRELQLEEQREVVRILTAFTATLRPYIDDLIATISLLGMFDFIRAKAVYAAEIGATLPHLSAGPELEWYHACHPLLSQALARQGKTIVPLDIRLGAQQRILIVSGPNAGGKSVTLKTVGLLQYMAQCGLLPPVYDNSHFGVFKNIFVDIGDDQSLEDDLSTYSSHLRNMKLFLQRGDKDTLFLIDELGGGTEPQIGGAIAQAVLTRFNAAGLWGVVTTHFHNLKRLAEETPGMVNGSMLYDRHLMQPLFALSIGNPGSSFALEIARKIGLPAEVIDDATDIVGSDYVNLDRYLLDIARDKRYWENKRVAIRQKEKQIEQLLDRYGSDAENMRAQRREIIADARAEAQRIVEGANAAIERTIREIRQAQAEKERTRLARKRLADEVAEHNASAAADGAADADIIKSSALLRAADARHRKKHKAEAARADKAQAPLKVGDNVLLDGAGTVGVIDSIEGDNAVVIFGLMRTSVKLKRLSRTLRKVSSGASKAASYISASTSDDSRQRQLNFKTEIDVRGMRADEAVQAVTYFIDDAIQFASARVRILHGTGTGALRMAIRQYLSTIDAIASYHDEDVRFGGAGITVVEF